MQIEEIPIVDIIPAPYNPRVELHPGDEEWTKIENSLDRFDLVQPMVWNRRTRHLVHGHQRLNVLKHKGRETVPCVVVDMPLEEEKALNLAMNKIGSDPDLWQKDKLFDVLAGLGDLASVTGFGEADLAALAADLDTNPLYEPVLEPTLPKLTNIARVSKESVEYAREHQADRFKGQPEIRDITCPYCAGIFGVAGKVAAFIDGKDDDA